MGRTELDYTTFTKFIKALDNTVDEWVSWERLDEHIFKGKVIDDDLFITLVCGGVESENPRVNSITVEYDQYTYMNGDNDNWKYNTEENKTILSSFAKKLIDKFGIYGQELTTAIDRFCDKV